MPPRVDCDHIAHLKNFKYVDSYNNWYLTHSKMLAQKRMLNHDLELLRMLLKLSKLSTTVLGTLSKNQSGSLLLAHLQINLNPKHLKNVLFLKCFFFITTKISIFGSFDLPLILLKQNQLDYFPDTHFHLPSPNSPL